MNKTLSKNYSEHSDAFVDLGRARGFTLLELLIFSGIFTIAMVAFLGILVTVTRIHISKLSAAEVSQQSQFLLQVIQREVERSSAIDITADTEVSELKLRMASSTEDPTWIRVSGEIAQIKRTDGGSWEDLTSDDVRVTDLSFTKRTNRPGHDSVNVDFAVEYNTTNPEREFSQMLETAVARVSAATFDSNVVPGSASTYQLGTSGANWTNINDAIYFSGSNVGVGASSPGAKLQVGSGDVYIDNSSNGLVLRSPDSTCWWVQVNNAGSLTTSSSTCP